MKRFFLFGFLISLALSGYSAEKYYLEFLAKRKDLSGKSPGHIFLEITRVQNGISKSYGKCGFAPKKNINGRDYGLKEYLKRIDWEGAFTTNDKEVIELRYKIEINKELFEKALEVKFSWNNSSTFYKAGQRDCITFVLEVAKAVNINVERSNVPPSLPEVIFSKIKKVHSKN